MDIRFELDGTNEVYQTENSESSSIEVYVSSSDSDCSEYVTEDIRFNLGDPDEPDDAECERITWACQRVIYPPREWKYVPEGGRGQKVYTLLDVFEPGDLEALPEVYDSLRSSRNAILREVARYGPLKDDTLPRVTEVRFLMIYPASPEDSINSIPVV
jgi:hypothetical protein